MQDYEKLRPFYVGRLYDLEQGARRDDLIRYDAKDLTTHIHFDGLGQLSHIRDAQGRLMLAWI